MCATRYWYFRQHSLSSFLFCWIPWHKAAAFPTWVIFFCLFAARVSWINPSCKALIELANKVFYFLAFVNFLTPLFHFSTLLSVLSSSFCFSKSASNFTWWNLQLFLGFGEIVNKCSWLLEQTKVSCVSRCEISGFPYRYSWTICLFTENPLSVLLWPWPSCQPTRIFYEYPDTRIFQLSGI